MKGRKDVLVANIKAKRQDGDMTYATIFAKRSKWSGDFFGDDFVDFIGCP